MPNNGPIDLETQANGVPAVSGREIDNPDNNPADTIMPVVEKQMPAYSKDMPDLEAKLKFIPVEMHDRVRKLTRDDLASPGMPVDREAYNAFLYAEKMMRDQARRANKGNLSGNEGPNSFSA